MVNASDRKVKIGIIGTGLWANIFHLPALSTCAQANIVAVSGHHPAQVQEFAKRWNIPQVFNNYKEMLESGLVEAVFILTSNATHYPIAMEALNHNVHVLCEKPLALNYVQAAEMAALAQERHLVTTVGFTYRYLPLNRYLKQLLEQGYIGTPYFLHLTYFATYAREPGQYMWRYDREIAGSGALGDLGAHLLDLAEWFYGEIEAVCAQPGVMVNRAELTPQGLPYTQADDSTILMVRFKNGAQGMIHVTSIAYEKTSQNQNFDFYGSDGALHAITDAGTIQEIRGGRSSLGEDPSQKLVVPDSFWGKVRREKVFETLFDTFQKDGYMVHEFVSAVANGNQLKPDFATGARVQQLIDAALLSAEKGCWIQTN